MLNFILPKLAPLTLTISMNLTALARSTCLIVLILCYCTIVVSMLQIHCIHIFSYLDFDATMCGKLSCHVDLFIYTLSYVVSKIELVICLFIGITVLCYFTCRFSADPETSMGLVQHEGGPCGVLAAIQVIV